MATEKLIYIVYKLPHDTLEHDLNHIRQNDGYLPTHIIQTQAGATDVPRALQPWYWTVVAQKL